MKHQESHNQMENSDEENEVSNTLSEHSVAGKNTDLD